MADDIDAVRVELVALGSATQLQWADDQIAWDQGTIIARRDGTAIVLTQLGRVEAEDRVERFASEEEAASELRRRLLGWHVRQRSPEERAESTRRMQQRAEEIKAELRTSGPNQLPPGSPS